MAKPINLSQRVSESIQQQLRLQEKHSQMLKSIESIEADEHQTKKIVSLGWSGLLQAMKKESFPPSSQDWDQWLKLPDDQTPVALVLNKVEDPLLRGQLCLLSSASDTAQQISSMARFAEIVGAANSPELERVFQVWGKRSAVESMLKQCEQHDVKDKKAIERLEITRVAFDIIGEWAIEQLHVDPEVDPSNCYDPILLECGEDHAMSQPTTSMA